MKTLSVEIHPMEGAAVISRNSAEDAELRFEIAKFTEEGWTAIQRVDTADGNHMVFFSTLDPSVALKTSARMLDEGRAKAAGEE